MVGVLSARLVAEHTKVTGEEDLPTLFILAPMVTPPDCDTPPCHWFTHPMPMIKLRQDIVVAKVRGPEDHIMWALESDEFEVLTSRAPSCVVHTYSHPAFPFLSFPCAGGNDTG